MQFSGGFVFAVIAGYPVYRHWNRLTRCRHSLDGYAYGLTIGLAIGRIGCYSVGEHFGPAQLVRTGRPLRWRLGPREPTLGDRPVAGRQRLPLHPRPCNELMYLLVLFAAFTWLLHIRSTPRRGPAP